MALQKQPVTFNFLGALDTKSDPFQLPTGNFTELVNISRGKTGALEKRAGFGFLPSLPDNLSSFVTTFNGNMTALGDKLWALSESTNSWVNTGTFYPLRLDTLSVVKNNLNQTWADTAVSPNGLLACVYTDQVPVGSTTQAVQKYTILDRTTGQTLVNSTPITSSFGTVSFSPRVFNIGNYFLVTFTSYNGAVYHLQYIPISTSTLNVMASATDISDTITPTARGSWDGVVANDKIYFSWNAANNSSVKTTSIDKYLNAYSVLTLNSVSAQLMSVTADKSGSTPVIWSSFYSATSSNAYTYAVNQIVNPIGSMTQFASSANGNILNIASFANIGVNSIFYEVANNYSYGTVTATNYINKVNVSVNGSISATTTIARSVGLASKAFMVGSQGYFSSVYQSPYQSTYFLMNSTGAVVSRLAYQNAQGYQIYGLTDVSVSSNSASLSYLYKDQVEAVNKDTNVSAGTQINGIYSQLGVNLVNYTFDSKQISPVETAGNLNLNSGFLWAYDGTQLVEQNFFLYPDNVALTPSTTGGTMSAQTYFYQVTYEWSDNQGNNFKSAPSIPVSCVTTGGTSSVTIQVPTLRLTYKNMNKPKVVIYRWSTAQQTYYQVTRIDVPLLNNTAIDSVSFTDTQSDAQILGNNLLYTTGGVLENSGGPSYVAQTLYDNRIFGINAENPNLLGYSKEIVQSTPLELSDFLTLYVPPTTSTKISTGPMKCLAPMDDKLIIFKKNAIYYINGIGPDSTGAQSQYSQPILITSTIGCSNQQSIVMSDIGLMFQSDKGIWLLGRDLSTSYIGDDVQAFNGLRVLSAVSVPQSNQLRFTLEGGGQIVYDYFYKEWNEFRGISAISSTIYENLHSFIDQYGRVYQQTPGLYLDGSTPVLMSWKTGWLNLAGLQGYQRAYKMYMLSNYQSPHICTFGVAYNFNPNIAQLAKIYPDNFSQKWGVSSTWGDYGTTWGGNSTVEQWQINIEQQQCQSFQVSFNEYYDPSYGLVAGAGLTMSGITVVAGVKKGWPGNVRAVNRVT